ncbi:hypothetical protein ABTZ03_27950 [Kitasatospora sp. NPDC096077]|uniref:hypothetical protein n=1 Tax=unclassified Kitasatospora TaxID=2633591 RepID=UPI003333B669
MLRSALTVLWFVIAGVGGLLLAFNVAGLAERFFDLIVRYSFTGAGSATPNVIRLVGAVFALAGIVGGSVLLVASLRGN